MKTFKDVLHKKIKEIRKHYFSKFSNLLVNPDECLILYRYYIAKLSVLLNYPIYSIDDYLHLVIKSKDDIDFLLDKLGVQLGFIHGIDDIPLYIAIDENNNKYIVTREGYKVNIETQEILNEKLENVYIKQLMPYLKDTANTKKLALIKHYAKQATLCLTTVYKYGKVLHTLKKIENKLSTLTTTEDLENFDYKNYNS